MSKKKIRDIKVWGTEFAGKVFPASEIRPEPRSHELWRSVSFRKTATEEIDRCACS